MYRARSLGLIMKEVRASGDTLEDYFQAIRGSSGADILNIRFHCPQEFLRLVYHASNAVLANSGHEPFGLVGLEAMAAGGIVFTGSTGEDYAIPLHNAIVLETSDPKEIEAYIMYLEEHPDKKKGIRRAAREAARRYVWEEVVKILIHKLEYQARIQGLLAAPRRTAIPPPEPSDHPAAVPICQPVPVAGM